MIKKDRIGGLGHSAATSLPRLASLGHLTADKRGIKDFPKPSPLCVIRGQEAS